MDQGSFGLFITDSSMTLPFRCYKPYEDRSKAVSYTHLDVYKRQVLYTGFIIFFK